jgi:hypothetical protein
MEGGWIFRVRGVPSGLLYLPRDNGPTEAGPTVVPRAPCITEARKDNSGCEKSLALQIT